MSFFDTLDDIKYHAGRFFLPVLFLIVGLVLLKMAVVPVQEQLNSGKIIEVTQNSNFLYASLFFLVASVIWFLYLFGIIRSGIGYGVMGLMAVLSAVLIYTDYSNIKKTVDFEAALEIRDLDIKARMGDLKAAELAYKEANGVYTNSMDDLINFVKTGTKMKILKKGQIPERRITPDERDFLYNDDRPIDKLMTELEAARLAKSPFGSLDTTGLKEFIRDTNFIPVMEAIFLEEKYLINRDKIGASLNFNADSLRFVPHSKLLVGLDTGYIDKGDLKVPTLFIQMDHPLNGNEQLKEPISYAIGAIDDNHLRESWKDN